MTNIAPKDGNKIIEFIDSVSDIAENLTEKITSEDLKKILTQIKLFVLQLPNIKAESEEIYSYWEQAKFAGVYCHNCEEHCAKEYPFCPNCGVVMIGKIDYLGRLN